METQAFEKRVEETRGLYSKISSEIECEIKESEDIKKRLLEISERIEVLNTEIASNSHKRGCLEELLLEIDRGFDKILASSQCLFILATRKLKMLNRKYSKYIRYNREV